MRDRDLFGCRGRGAAQFIMRQGLALASLATLAGAQSSQFTEYTSSADFDRGTLLNVHHEGALGDQLQLDTVTLPFDYLNVTTTNGDGPREGTVVRIDTATGEILGEYRTSPSGRASNPSRTTVDLYGNVWVGNRDVLDLEVGGTVVKIGVVVGGTRCLADGSPHPQGGYLKPPFEYSTAVDRDGDGLIRTSRGLGDVLTWPDITDGDGGAAGGPALVEDAEDELILVYQRTSSDAVRHVSIDPQNDVWIGGYPGAPLGFERLSSDTGAILESVQSPSCGGYGGLIDSAGVVWSVSSNENALLRLDPSAGGASQCIPVQNPYGTGIDSAGQVWVTQRDRGSITKVGPDGTVIFSDKPVPGAILLRGVALDPATDHAWVADSMLDAVFHLNSNGDLVGPPIPVGRKPSGISVDGFGKVWVTCRVSGEAYRIDPTAGGWGAVDLVVPLAPASTPYNYSDMTGVVSYTTTLEVGCWEVLQDGGMPQAHWGRIRWNGIEANGAELRVQARAADNQAALTSQPWLEARHNVRTNLMGRFLQTRVKFERSPLTTESPTLHDISIEQLGLGVDTCNAANRRRPGSLLLYPEFDSRPGIQSLVTVTNVSGDEVDVEFVYINGTDCLEFNRTHLLTAGDTLSLLPRLHNPNQERGYLYVFAKSPDTGEPIVHNGLIGQVMNIDGLEAFEYSINAVSFAGLGDGTITDLDMDGVRDLDGAEYEMAPDEVQIPRFLGQAEGQAFGPAPSPDIRSRLILVALSGGPDFTTTLDFLIYNDNEEEFSSEYTFHCWEKVKLLDVSGIFAQDFLRQWTNHAPLELLGAPAQEAGWMRINGALAHSSAHTILDPAFYAVLVERVSGFGVADLPFELCTQDNGDLLPGGLFGDS